MKKKPEQLDLDDPHVDVLIDEHGISVESGRYELRRRFLLNPNSTPRLSGGDVDAQWEMAESTGDETIGGSSPTPDQNGVDEAGEALGVAAGDGEELVCSGERTRVNDEHRWELDPASSEDYLLRARR